MVGAASSHVLGSPMLTKTKPFSIPRAPSLGFSKDLLNDPRIMNMNLLETWWSAAKIETFVLGFSYNSFQNVVQVLPSFFDWLRRLDRLRRRDPSLSNSVVAYKRDSYRNVTNENSREALGVRNTFSYGDISKLKDSNPKAIMKFLIQACDYK